MTTRRTYVLTFHRVRRVVFSRQAAVSILFSVLTTTMVSAQTVTTNITSSGLNTNVTANGNIQNITGGTRAGSNLFHSFGQFSVGAGDVANFQNTAVGGGFPLTSNILARVTGGQPSQIYGTLRTTDYGNANLFLLNPRGVVFGPTASLDIGATTVLGGVRGAGSFYASTADYLRLSDGVTSGYFYANPVHTDVLTTDPVVAFGFLTLEPGTTRGSIAGQGSNLSVGDGQTIGFIGGNIMIGVDSVSGTPAALSAPNGQIQLASAASPGEFLLAGLQSAPNVNLDSFTSHSSVQLASGSLVDVTGTGKVSIRGGAFTLEVKESVLSTEAVPSPPGGATLDTISLSHGSALVTSTAGSEAGADVQLVGRTISLDGASITSITTGDGNGGAVTATADDSINLTSGTQIVSSTSGAGSGGDITLAATNSVLISGFDTTGTLTGVSGILGVVASGLYSLTSSSGQGGHLRVSAPTGTVTIENGGTVGSIASGDGAGGNTTVEAETLNVIDGGQVVSFTGFDLAVGDVTAGSGASGNITVTAQDALTVSGTSPDLGNDSRIWSQTLGVGKAGDISTVAPTTTVESRGQLASERILEEAASGNISVSAASSLLIDGSSSRIHSDTGSISVSAGSATVRNQGAVGTNGNIDVQVQSDLNITAGGTIQADQGGTIGITADKVVVSGQIPGRSTIKSTGVGTAAGDITITVRDLQVADRGLIRSESTGAAQNGSIFINNADSVAVSNLGEISTINSGGLPGQVSVNGQTITLTQGVIRTTADGTGNASAINLTGNTVTLDKSLITSATNGGTARGGDVTVNATNNLEIKGLFTNDSGVTSASGILARTFATGDAGNVLVNAGNIQFSGGGRINNGSLSSGNGGTIIVNGQSISVDGLNSGVLSEASSTGRGGNITINAGQSVSLNNNASISASSTGTATNAGNAGSISINTAGNFESSGGKVSTTAMQAQGGDINITAGQDIRLTNNASVSANSTGTGNAGNITAIAGDDFVMQNSSITTQAVQASGGNIKIGATDQIVIRNSLISASVMGGSGSGGNISIDPNVVVLQNSQILAQAIQGNGGNITIFTPLFLADSSSLVSASSQFGLNGTVTIQNPTSNLSGSLGTLATKPRQAQSLLTQRCAALANGQASSFVVAGREQLPADPGGWLTSPLALAGLDADPFTVAEGTSHLAPRTSGLLANGTVSLRRFTPAGFLMANYADSEATGCHS